MAFLVNGMAKEELYVRIAYITLASELIIC